MRSQVISRCSSLSPEHPDVANNLRELAELYDAHGQFAKGEPLFQRALSIQEHVLGPVHPDVAATLDAYAQVFRKTDRGSDAAALENRAQAIRSLSHWH